MFRPLLLFLTGGRNKQQIIDRDYAPVATDEESITIPAHLHPLLIPMVISKISTHLSVNDLLNFRMVCRSWHAESYKLLQRRIKFVKVHPRKMHDFLRVFRRSFPVPATGYSFYVDHPEHLFTLKSITENLADSITSLRLFLSSQEIPNLSKILQNLYLLKELILLRIPEKSLPPPYRKYEILEQDLHLPHLTCISFRNTHPTLPFICNYDNFIIEIINGAGNLTTLEFQNWKSSLQQIIRFSEMSVSLEKLVLEGSVVNESEIGALIKKKNLGLKNFKIHLGKSVRESTLTSLFQCLQDSLENLDITCDVVSTNFPVHCSLLELKHLKFQSWKCQITLDNFLRHFPKLETVQFLDFQFVGFTDYNNLRTGNEPKSLVHTVKIRPCVQNEHLPLAELNLASILTAFPNVKKFKGSFITDSMCDLIFKYWTQLESLSLETSCGYLTDYGLTGILPQVLPLNKDSCSHWSKIQVNPPERVNNYLGNLKELKYLFLNGDFNGLLTNNSLLHGILDLKNLQELGIPNEAFQWCFECMASKLKKLKRLHVDPNNSKVNVQDILFLKERIENLQIVLSTKGSKKGNS